MQPALLDNSHQVSHLSLKRKWEIARSIFWGLGVFAAPRYLWYHTLRFGEKADYWLKPRGISYPVAIRPDSSDIHAFKLIFLEGEYACLDDLSDVRLVLDCGANVGYSSVYFLSKFPRCSVIAVEPAADNFAALERNLAPYGDRAKCVRAGVWTHSAPLRLSKEKYREGTQWSQQVTICGPGEAAEFQGVDIGKLLADSGHDRISLLKMDVEGAEAVIFAENYQHWLDKVDVIAIELHDDSMFGRSSDVFFSAIQGRNYRISQSAELTICR